MIDLAPFVAVFIGALAQKFLHRGVELGLLELAAFVPLLLVLERIVRPRLALAVGSSAHRASMLGATLLGLLAVFVYPLPLVGGWAVLAFDLAGLFSSLAPGPVAPDLVRRLGLASAALAVAFAVATHLVAMAAPPSYDPALYLLDGRWLLEGIAPYRDAHLSKPPVILVPNALFAVLGDVHVLPQLASLACALATGAILARSPALANDPRHGLVFAVAVGLLSLEEYRQGGNYPETYSPPLIALAWACLMAPEPRRRDLLIGGFSIGLLSMTKQTHALYGAALLGMLALLERARPGRVALAAGAACGAVACVLAPFAATGLLGPFFRSTVLYWLHPLPILATPGTLFERLIGLSAPVAPLLLLALAAVLRVLAAWKRGRAPERPVLGFLVLLATASILQIIEQRIFRNPHYVLHAFVPVALAPWVLGRSVTARREQRLVLILLAEWSLLPFAIQVLGFPGTLGVAREQRVLIEKLAAATDRVPPAPSAGLLVLGGWPQVYLASTRRCLDPGCFTGLLLAQEAAKGPEGQARVRALLRRRPLVVLIVEGSAELELVEKYLPGWRDELADLEPERPSESITILR